LNQSIGYDYIPISGYASHGKAQVFMAKPPVRKMITPIYSPAGFPVRYVSLPEGKPPSIDYYRLWFQ
jgi:hypothetical protein